MSEASSEVAPEGERRSAVEGGIFALLAYVLWYDIGTVVFEIAEPATHALVWPAMGVGAAFWIAEKSSGVPRPVVNLGVLLLPIIVAVVTISITA